MYLHMLKLVCALCITLALSICSVSADPTAIRAVTYPFAPLQIEENTDASGYAIEIVEKLFELVKHEDDELIGQIDILPFKRAYAAAEMDKNTLFFSISRTPQREEKFHWIGEISPYELYFFKLEKNYDLQAQSLQDILNAGYLVAVQDKSNMERLLLDSGFKYNENYTTYPHYSNGIKMLFRDRFTMLPLTSFVARTNTCNLGFDGAAIEPVFKIESLSNPLWLVFSLNTPLETVALFKEKFALLKADGTIHALQRKYLDIWEKGKCG